MTTSAGQGEKGRAAMSGIKGEMEEKWGSDPRASPNLPQPLGTTPSPVLPCLLPLLKKWGNKWALACKQLLGLAGTLKKGVRSDEAVSAHKPQSHVAP